MRFASSKGWIALGTLAAFLSASVAAAEPTRVVVLLTGDGEALVPAASVGRALMLRLARSKKRTVRLAYLAPELPIPKALKAQESKAAKLLKKAHAAFEMMEYDKVKTQTEEALKLYKALLKAGVPSDGYVQALHLLAAASQLQGESKLAYRAMNDAMLFDPRPPSKKLFNPTVQEFYEQVRAEAPAHGTLALGSTPPALVWLNGELHGPATGKVSLRSGLYLVRFYAPGCAPLQKWMRVKAHEERRLAPTLQRDEAPENEVNAKLREEGKAQEPGTAVSQVLLDLGADELVLLNPGKGCTPARCTVHLHWAKEGRWDRNRKATFSGQPEQTVADLLGVKLEVAQPPERPKGDPTVSSERACTLDSQCFMNERCKNGRCVLPRPVTRTWWFWTLMGVGVAGITLAIVLPLTGPARPVIEVR